MEDSTQREKILKRVRNSLIYKTDNPFPNPDFESNIYKEMTDSPEVVFAEEFIKVSGKFVYCESENEFVENMKALINENQWTNIFCKEDKVKKILETGNIPFLSDESDLHEIEVGITQCEYLIARLGSIMVSSRQQCGRKMFVYPPIHIVLAYTSQLVTDLKQALAGIKQKYTDNIPSMISVITGPSRTADIEKTLIMGAHGPKEIYVFLIDDTVYE
ncbi:MAG: LUD domain-containing protein [Bacteroidales bacterium]|jgi:L-lactate dehydrogenase complex protein LldG